jgi:hypothetical protein
LSNPIRDTKVGWFDIDNESFDNYNVRDKSYRIGFMANYKLKASNIRVRFSYTRINIEEFRDITDSGVNKVTSVKGKQNKFTIAPGITWSFNREKLNLDFGFELPYTIHGTFELNSESIRIQSGSGDLVSDFFSKSEIPSGYTVGIGAIVGFNYFIWESFSIGAEYSPSLSYGDLGGETETLNMSATNPSSQTMPLTSQDSYEGFTFFENRFSLTISFWL